MNLDIMVDLEIIDQVVSLNQLQDITLLDKKQQIINKIVDKLVIVQENDKILMQLEKDIEPMSEIVSKGKLVKFQQMLRQLEGREDDDKIDYCPRAIKQVSNCLAGNK